jgi:hypothetical protein
MPDGKGAAMLYEFSEHPTRGMFAAPLSAAEREEIHAALHLRKQKVTAIGIDRRGGPFSLVIGEIRDIVDLDEIACTQNPVNLGATWSGVSLGVYRHSDGLLVIMAIDRSEAEAVAEDLCAAA